MLKYFCSALFTLLYPFIYKIDYEQQHTKFHKILNGYKKMVETAAMVFNRNIIFFKHLNQIE